MPIFSSLSYLEKNRYAPRQILNTPNGNMGMVVVIPCYNEHKLIRTLESLATCQVPPIEIEVIVVLNASERSRSEVLTQNEKTFEEARTWNKSRCPFFPLHLLNFPSLRHKHAGVGLARKIGMDEAVDRLEQAGYPEGVIVCLDADSQVEPSYLSSIWNHFQHHPKCPACSIHFEHPLSGDEFPEQVYDGIIQYELFLRYYLEGLRYAGYPYAYHTIGSSMAVRSSAYQAEGGMNRRKAGEDFYFLHKFTPNPHFGEVHDTCVIPSPRSSDKVPFGTGRAIQQWLAKPTEFMEGYHPIIFQELKAFMEQLPDLYKEELKLPQGALATFLEQENFSEQVQTARKHVRSADSFPKRLLQWLDPLKVLKYVHFARDNAYPNLMLPESVEVLGSWLKIEKREKMEVQDWLLKFRSRQRKAHY